MGKTVAMKKSEAFAKVLGSNEYFTHTRQKGGVIVLRR